jgi:hypothetical protein
VFGALFAVIVIAALVAPLYAEVIFGLPGVGGLTANTLGGCASRDHRPERARQPPFSSWIVLPPSTTIDWPVT